MAASGRFVPACLLFLPLSALLAPAARAVRPEPGRRADAGRFDRSLPGTESRGILAGAPVDGFNTARSALRARGAAGLPSGSLTPEGARALLWDFVRSRRETLSWDSGDLRIERENSEDGLRHFLLTQSHEGVPVEFSRVKVHVSEAGEVLAFSSNLRPGAFPSGRPQAGEAQAAAAAAADLGGGAVQGPGSLVYYPVRGADPRLAWKFFFSGTGGRWIYYVDAGTGEVLFRYDELRYAACVTSGSVLGQVYDLDPSATPGPTLRAIAHQNVYVAGASTYAVTEATGGFCSQSAGKIVALLQGPYARVADFNGPGAYYDNGGGVWSTAAASLASPNPYSNNTVHSASLTVSSTAILLLPHFSAFNVGALNADGDITDNDQVAVLDGSGTAVATYIGNKGAFSGALVAGATLELRLRSDESGTRSGYSVDYSSSMRLTLSPSVPDNATSSFTWTSARTFSGTIDEINLFYHVNKMHDYFLGGVDASSAAPISRPLTVMARLGGLANAYYDPRHGHLAFGAVGNAFALDATVIRHEYTHYVVDRIYPVLNFGQHGAISEGIADYFSAASLGTSAIGTYVNTAFEGSGALRDLNCPSASTCKSFPQHWTGEIHDDSLILSQALWSLRQSLIGTLGASSGAACADGLAFRSLLFFPDSFREFLDAMLLASGRSASLVPSCGANGARDSDIASHFSVHGVSATLASGTDVYEPNDGTQAATHISSRPVIEASIYPAQDQDFYSFGAAAGRVTLTLTLPDGGSGTRLAYALTLIDKDLSVVASAAPSLNVNAVSGGYCPDDGNCLTTASEVVLTYENPGAGLLYALVAGASNSNGFNSRTNSTQNYSLKAVYPRAGPVSAGVVSAVFDKDGIDFSVRVATFVKAQNYVFSHTALRDHALKELANTSTRESGSYVSVASTSDAGGTISGRLALTGGLGARFPAVGTVHLEVFGVNPLGVIQPLGLSPPFNLTASRVGLSAWNNVFNPAKGEKATLKYETLEPGHVRLRLFSLSGALVLTLVDEFKPAGKGSVDWEGVNLSGARVASGIYYAHLDAPGVRQVQKVIVVK